MTTIAYRDGVLAADTAQSAGDEIVARIVKIVRRSDGGLAGAAGHAGYNARFRDWFAGGEKGEAPKPTSDDDCLDRGVIFRRDGTIEIHEPDGVFTCTAPYFAFGSGRAIALGAMFVGADAEAAVKAAIQHDKHTAGEITVLRHS